MSLSDKYIITGYQNNINNNNINKNSSSDSDGNTGGDNEDDSHTKIICIPDEPGMLVNDKSTKIFGYC